MDVVERRIEVGGRGVVVVLPSDPVALLHEEAFEREELLPYWAELWPSGIALANHVARLPLAGASVLELGCGLALPALAAALAGGRVLATDWSRDALAFAARNAALNGAEIETLLVRWDEPGVLIRRGPFDLVLAADVLYERRSVDQLLALLTALLAPLGSALVADPGRRHLEVFVERATRLWTVAAVPDVGLPNGGIYRLATPEPGHRGATGSIGEYP